MRQVVLDHADLEADAWVFHDADEVLDLLVRDRLPPLLDARRKAAAAFQSVLEKLFDLDRRDNVGERGLAAAKHVLPLAQRFHDARNVVDQPIALGLAAQDLFDGIDKPLRGEQKRNRPGQGHDMFGCCLDLPESLEIGGCRGDVLDADAQQGRDRDAQQLCEAFDGLELADFAALEAVKRRPRYAELVGDFIGSQIGAEPKGPDPVADLVVAKAHFRLRKPMRQRRFVAFRRAISSSREGAKSFAGGRPPAQRRVLQAPDLLVDTDRRVARMPDIGTNAKLWNGQRRPPIDVKGPTDEAGTYVQSPSCIDLGIVGVGVCRGGRGHLWR